MGCSPLPPPFLQGLMHAWQMLDHRATPQPRPLFSHLSPCMQAEREQMTSFHPFIFWCPFAFFFLDAPLLLLIRLSNFSYFVFFFHLKVFLPSNILRFPSLFPLAPPTPTLSTHLAL